MLRGTTNTSTAIELLETTMSEDIYTPPYTYLQMIITTTKSSPVAALHYLITTLRQAFLMGLFAYFTFPQGPTCPRSTHINETILACSQGLFVGCFLAIIGLFLRLWMVIFMLRILMFPELRDGLTWVMWSVMAFSWILLVVTNGGSGFTQVLELYFILFLFC